MLICLYIVFFFFKQKTAYELRISDWSSDVCSSDLADEPVDQLRPPRRRWLGRRELCAGAQETDRDAGAAVRGLSEIAAPATARYRTTPRNNSLPDAPAGMGFSKDQRMWVTSLCCAGRSEEHTSELQSLMRISYAVFCLKKKKTH